MRRLWMFLSCMMIISLAGCYEMNVKNIVSGLKIGMSKADLDGLMKGQRLLKEQTVVVYPGVTETQTRASAWNNQNYKSVFPEDLITNRLAFDGDVKVYSYLVKETKRFAAPVIIDYLAVFYSQKDKRVIGWAQMETSGEVRTWDDNF